VETARSAGLDRQHFGMRPSLSSHLSRYGYRSTCYLAAACYTHTHKSQRYCHYFLCSYDNNNNNHRIFVDHYLPSIVSVYAVCQTLFIDTSSSSSAIFCPFSPHHDDNAGSSTVPFAYSTQIVDSAGTKPLNPMVLCAWQLQRRRPRFYFQDGRRFLLLLLLLAGRKSR
jgi:hypothetical protein